MNKNNQKILYFDNNKKISLKIDLENKTFSFESSTNNLVDLLYATNGLSKVIKYLDNTIKPLVIIPEPEIEEISFADDDNITQAVINIPEVATREQIKEIVEPPKQFSQLEILNHEIKEMERIFELKTEKNEIISLDDRQKHQKMVSDYQTLLKQNIGQHKKVEPTYVAQPVVNIRNKNGKIEQVGLFSNAVNVAQDFGATFTNTVDKTNSSTSLDRAFA